MTIPVCEICHKPKVMLPERTELTHEPIYVCSEKVGKNKMPCDGSVWDIASKRQS